MSTKWNIIRILIRLPSSPLSIIVMCKRFCMNLLLLQLIVDCRRSLASRSCCTLVWWNRPYVVVSAGYSTAEWQRCKHWPSCLQQELVLVWWFVATKKLVNVNDFKANKCYFSNHTGQVSVSVICHIFFGLVKYLTICNPNVFWSSVKVRSYLFLELTI